MQSAQVASFKHSSVASSNSSVASSVASCNQLIHTINSSVVSRLLEAPNNIARHIGGSDNWSELSVRSVTV